MSSTLAFRLMTLISARRGAEPSSWLILKGFASRLRFESDFRGFGTVAVKVVMSIMVRKVQMAKLSARYRPIVCQVWTIADSIAEKVGVNFLHDLGDGCSICITTSSGCQASLHDGELGRQA